MTTGLWAEADAAEDEYFRARAKLADAVEQAEPYNPLPPTVLAALRYYITCRDRVHAAVETAKTQP